MNKKFFLAAGIIVIIIVGIVLVFNGAIDNNIPTNSANWKTNEVAGVKFKIPDKYANGMTSVGNVIDGKHTGNYYQSQNNEFYAYVFTSNENNTEWNTQLNNYMKNETASAQLLNISGNEIKVFEAEDNYSIGFFNVGEDKIIIKWKGEVNGDIKSIIKSFYELNK